jgi:hypothetical protein
MGWSENLIVRLRLMLLGILHGGNLMENWEHLIFGKGLAQENSARVCADVFLIWDGGFGSTWRRGCVGTGGGLLWNPCGYCGDVRVGGRGW